MITDTIKCISSISICLWMNRCRGSHFGNLINSTSQSRIISSTVIALWIQAMGSIDFIKDLEVGIWVSLSLMLWSVFAWDGYWSCAIGNEKTPPKKVFWPVDKIMKIFPIPTSDLGLRLWGMVAMTLRQSLAAISIVGVAYICDKPLYWIYGIGVLTLGIPYFIFGYFSKAYCIQRSEWTVGAILGGLLYLARV